MAFSSSKKTSSDYDNNSPISESHSFFGKTMRIEGEITSDEDLTIEGKVDGQLDVSKTLTIGNDGYVSGSISASVVRINGGAEGRLTAREKLEITSEGKFNGHISAQRIKVAEGAQLKGNINTEERAPEIEEKKVFPKPEEKTDEKIEEKIEEKAIIHKPQPEDDNLNKKEDETENETEEETEEETEDETEEKTEVIKRVNPKDAFNKKKNFAKK